MKNTDRTDLEIQNIMHDINEVARKHNVAILLVAHYKKLNKDKPDNDSFKDASAIKQVSNVIIHITRNYEE
jgi:RecA-family ATPase